MSAIKKADMRGVWALTWRSFLLMPITFLLFVVLTAWSLSRYMLPVLAVWSAFHHQWAAAAMEAVTWMALALSYHQLRIAEFYRDTNSQSQAP